MAMAFTNFTPNEIDCLITEAGESGDLAKLKEVQERIGDEGAFRRKCNVVNDCCHGRRILHIAAEMGHFEICKFLIENVRVKIDVLDHRGDTPLLYAVKEKHIQIVEYLINQGALVEMSDSKGLTSLHYAAQMDNMELLELLVTKGAPIESDSVDGTPLQCAASCGNVGAMKFLLDHGAEPNSASLIFGSPLICSIKSGSFECMELLLKAGANPNKFLFGSSPLAHAAKEGKPEFVKCLLKAGADASSQSTDTLRPIEEAALASNVECVRILLPFTRGLSDDYPNWTVNGIIEKIHSEEAKRMREHLRSICLNILDTAGKNAVARSDYSIALKCYSEAAYLDPPNSKWVANRSLCFARVGRAVHALRDAKESVRMSPASAKAHYREGVAWMLLENSHMAALAFRAALLLAPEDAIIKQAYADAVGKNAARLLLSSPREMTTWLQQIGIDMTSFGFRG